MRREETRKTLRKLCVCSGGGFCSKHQWFGLDLDHFIAAIATSPQRARNLKSRQITFRQHGNPEINQPETLDFVEKTLNQMRLCKEGGRICRGFPVWRAKSNHHLGAKPAHAPCQIGYPGCKYKGYEP